MYIVTSYYKTNINTFSKKIETVQSYYSAMMLYNKFVNEQYKLLVNEYFNDDNYYIKGWDNDDIAELKLFAIQKHIQVLNNKDKINKYREFFVTIDTIHNEINDETKKELNEIIALAE